MAPNDVPSAQPTNALLSESVPLFGLTYRGWTVPTRPACSRPGRNKGAQLSPVRLSLQYPAQLLGFSPAARSLLNHQ
eukprot:3881588-Amphidinium_carterae.1